MRYYLNSISRAKGLKHTGETDFDLHLVLTSIPNGNELSLHVRDTLSPGKETPGTRSVSGWVDPRAGADVMGRQKYLVLAEDGTPDRPARNLVPTSTTSSDLLSYRVKIFF